MKLDAFEITLSGKGFETYDLSYPMMNLKIQAEKATFYEIRTGEKHAGWLVLDKLEMIADYTIHTETGMKGKSTRDEITHTLILDPESCLQDIIPPELVDLDISEAQLVLDKLLKENRSINTRDAEIDMDEALLFISTVKEYVLIQTDDISMRIAGNDGVYILKEGEDEAKLTIINEEDGVMHFGRTSNVKVGPEGIFINDEKFDPQKIVMNVTKTLGESLGKSFRNMKFDFDFN